MSRNESHLRSFNFDTKFSSGDFNSMDHQPPQVFKEDGDYKQDGDYKEENNNEINELSKDLSEMGCIVEGVTRPPNICVETCVYDSDSESEENYSANENDEDNYYSDEFEEDRSEVEAKPVQYEDDNNKEENMSPPQSTINLSKSHSFMSCSKPPVSISGKSSNVSTAASRTRRVNMSFSNERLREIERHNHILLNKILSARNSRKSSIPAAAAERRPVPAAAVLRKKQQQKIDHDNMILLKKLQRAKSSSYSVRR